MKAVTKRAQKVLDALTRELKQPGDHARFDRAPKAYMATCVEVVGYAQDFGPIISVAHYYEQNGDLMKDPDMEFLKFEADGRYFPLTFEQSAPPIYNRAAWFEDGKLKHRRNMQADVTRFANTWLVNIRRQQEPERVPAVSMTT